MQPDARLQLLRRLAAAAAALAALALLAAGCGGSKSDDPGAFATHILREEISGQWAAQWGELNPGHQKLITRAQYVVCSQAMGTNFGTGKEKLDVESVRDVAIHVRNVSERTAKLVAVRLSNVPGQQPITYHVHAVRDSGRWTWILGATFLDAIAHHQCLDGSPLDPTT
ncbi:MAG TPA: hypothetical protein VHD91_11230 [Gaiellaceae bacterium]|nr:hypothetical protein [Gaiellaceae bacterium]